MAAFGRTAVLDALDGPGLPVMRQRGAQSAIPANLQVRAAGDAVRGGREADE